MRLAKLTDIKVSDSRQRREFAPDALVELAESIERTGLMHPVVVRDSPEGGYLLVAGERRLKAIETLWGMGEQLKCENCPVDEGWIPINYLGDLDPIDAYEAELDENIRRTDLTWQEKAKATAELYELRRLQSERDGTPAPTIYTLASELTGKPVSPTQGEGAYTVTRRELIVSKHLNNPDIAKARSADDAFKILKRQEDAQRSVELGISVGRTFNSDSHYLEQGDCLELMPKLSSALFDVILTDPPYGIDAQDYNDSGGMAPGGHSYDDSLLSWLGLMQAFSVQSFRLARPQAHAYVFCDVDNFHRLKQFMTSAGWNVFRTPLIWINPMGMRAPWPDQGPQRKWQMCLYATKGKKPTIKLIGDVLTYKSDENLGHNAQKPVDLLIDLLNRSARPGDTVFDPFCGTGSIIVAAHSLKVKATAFELDPAHYGIAVQRMKRLK